MAQTMNKEARRRKSRTYEGVQWFDHGEGHWVAAIPGTNFCVERFSKGKDGKCDAFVCQYVQDDYGGGMWLLATGMRLPWGMHTRGTVKSISRDVQVLRAFFDGRSPHGVA